MIRTLTLLCLVALLSGCSSSKPKLRIEAPAQHRDAFVHYLHETSACAGLELIKATYTLRTKPGTRRLNGGWQAPLPPHNKLGWGNAYRTGDGARANVAECPRTGAVDQGVLKHEALHLVLLVHGISGHPRAYRHCAPWWVEAALFGLDHAGCWFGADSLSMEPTQR